MRNAFLIAAALAVATVQAQGLPATNVSAIPTYESAGLYWTAPGLGAVTGGCEVRYRRQGDTAWRQGIAMWYDARNDQCRSSIVHLAAGSTYEVQFNLPGQAASRGLTFATWPNTRPVARTIAVASGSATLNVNQSGSPSGYVVYQGAPGAVLNGNNAVAYNVTINASYVIVRGLKLTGAQQDAIRIAGNVTDVIVEDNEITDWGRPRGSGYGVDSDSAIRAVCSTPTLTRVTIQRNEIHDPRYSTNSWSIGHPEGPQGITFNNCGGNNVIRHNEIFSTTGRYFNDPIGGSDNYSTAGFPNADSDIYGNAISHSWDDGIEAEGGNRNVRIWGNYIDRTAIGIASAPTTVGPLYMWRNVYNRSRYLEAVPPDQDDRNPMFKAGSDLTLGDGRRYVFHNTMLQARDPCCVYGMGGANGLSGGGTNRLMNNTVSMNNIWHGWRTWTAYYEPGINNYFERDMYNATPGAVVVNGIQATPTYAPGNGWQSEDGGSYQLQPATPGYDQATRIANFNDAFTGAGPDVGAHEGGTAPMAFGLRASPGPAVGASGLPSARARRDFNGDGRSDILWRSDATGEVYRMLMNGTSIANGAMVHRESNTAWRIVGDGDFNGDGISDVLWRNFSTGQVYVMLFGSSGFPASGSVVWTEPSPNWRIVQTPDFDGDGRDDILWWNSVTGQVFAILLDGASVRAQGLAWVEPDTAWRIVAAGDFAGSGRRNQVLWRHAGNGTVFMMTFGYAGGTFAATGATIYREADMAWKIVAAADFNGDRRDDVLWRNDVTGQVYVMLMNGPAVAGGAQVHVEPDTAWKIVAAGDYDGDGRADILWRNEATGQLHMMLVNGTTITARSTFYREPDLAWKVLGPWEYARP